MGNQFIRFPRIGNGTVSSPVLCFLSQHHGSNLNSDFPTSSSFMASGSDVTAAMLPHKGMSMSHAVYTRLKGSYSLTRACRSYF
jgi:hypothetical protein